MLSRYGMPAKAKGEGKLTVSRLQTT
jgi:hypothetical protein